MRKDSIKDLASIKEDSDFDENNLDETALGVVNEMAALRQKDLMEDFDNKWKEVQDIPKMTTAKIFENGQTDPISVQVELRRIEKLRKRITYQ